MDFLGTLSLNNQPTPLGRPQHRGGIQVSAPFTLELLRNSPSNCSWLLQILRRWSEENMIWGLLAIDLGFIIAIWIYMWDNK